MERKEHVFLPKKFDYLLTYLLSTNKLKKYVINTDF